MDSSRQKHLDSMRGIAAFIVVVMHFFVVFYPYSIFGARGNSLKHFGFESLFHTAPLGFIVAGYFAVCLFFILSGYVLSYRYLGEANCRSRIIAAMVKRPVRLGGLVLFSVLLSAFLWSSGLYYNGALTGITSPNPWFSVPWQGELVFNEFLTDVVFSLFSSGHKYNYPLWTISRELYGSLLVFAFLLFFSSNRYRLVFQIVLLALFKGSLYQGFLLGMIAADINKNYDFGFFKRENRFISLVLLVLGVFFSSYPYLLDEETLQKTLFGYLPKLSVLGGEYSMLGAFMLFLLVIRHSTIRACLETAVLQFFGRISYGMYVIHFIVLGSFSSWLFVSLQGHIGYGLSSLLTSLVSLLIIIVCAILLTGYVDAPSIAASSYVGNRAIAILKAIEVRANGIFKRGRG